ncbi:reductase [Paenibacillus yonginensis]|uniref:assimilatory sulfite reductase (NADPH) n=1 Tax=Paenibacillus yonginensis TaxID=1462996 RepID=A0A1B1MYH1_9BACL|nr:sulfite reductase subunit alpha [Paenibacillus yonginensis]ANS74228.1 reductase [Paenibacillus yonginensis]
MNVRQVRSVCPYCGVGCGIIMEVEDEQIIRIKGDPEHPANRGRLCTKGSTAAIPVTDSGRLSAALVRRSRQATPEPIGLDAAIQETADRLKAIVREHGPDAVSFYVSGQMSLEAQYLVNKLAKGFIRTSNIEANSRLCMASAASGYKLSLGADGPPGSYDDLDQAELFFVIGANMADCHPILFLRMMDRVKAGAKLIVVDPRRTATAEKADLYLRIKPGTDLALLNGLLHLLLQKGDIDESFIMDHTVGFETLSSFLEDYPPQRVADWTGIPVEDLRKAADWIGRSSNWMSLWTMGLNQSTHGTWHTNAICNLHLATGAICRPGSGPFSLTGQPNAMGGREMGYMGPGLPGQRTLLDEADREHTERLWGLPRGSLRAEVQPGTISMFERMIAGEIKACWMICTNPAATVPNRRKVLEGLQAAELVITQDAFIDTETNRYADLMLPGALWAEGEGVMVNSERNVTLMQKAVEPPGEALPDWQLIARVACAMGFSEAFSYTSARQVYEEIQAAWNPATGYDLRGADYVSLQEGPIQWPCGPHPEHPQRRNPIRYRFPQAQTQTQANKQQRLRFPTEHGRAVFWARPYLPPAELPDEDFPFVLNTGRVQHQWHTLTKTGKVAKLNKLNPGPFLEIHPEDARQLRIQEGNLVEIASRRGKALLPAVLTDRVQPGSCFAPIHWNDLYGSKLAINEVTLDAVDPVSLQPELKHCAVSLVKAETQPSAPDTSQPSRLSNPSSDGMRQDKIAVLSSMLGIPSSQKMELTESDQAYLSGFLKGMGSHFSFKKVPSLPPSADLDPLKRVWVNGLLAGLFAEDITQTREHEQPAPGPSTLAPSVLEPLPFSAASIRPVTMVWASQTGNAEEAAAYSAGKLKQQGIDVQLVGMNGITVQELAQESFVLFSVSTFGAGDPPDQGAAFFQALKAVDAPRLEQLNYAVLAFGDSSYDTFCEFGRKLDSRLQELGAKRILACTCCDRDYQEEIDRWLSVIPPLLAEIQAPSSSLASPNRSSQAAEASVRLLHAAASERAESAAESANVSARYSRQKPFPARLLLNRLLNRPGSLKETRQYAFDLSGSGLTYEAGDALGIWPSNCPQLADELLELLGFEASYEVIVNHESMTLRDALVHRYDIHRVTPGMLDYIRANPRETYRGKLADRLEADEQTLWLRHRQLIDLLQEFPAAVTASEWIQHLRPLQPRLYSISSSSRLYPQEVHITVSTVRYEHAGRLRKGVCSTFLADLLQPGDKVPVFIHKNPHFRPPADPHADLIMVGPGTGIAPFRGFLQEREALRAAGRSWLFFGEHYAALDFYYQDELEAYQNKHLLHRLDTAFSRDQPEKVYVQHRMAEHGAELWNWLDGGAYLYVCGDAAEMARSVDKTLLEMIREHGGLTAEQAEHYLNELKRSKRYCKDVY